MYAPVQQDSMSATFFRRVRTSCGESEGRQQSVKIKQEKKHQQMSELSISISSLSRNETKVRGGRGKGRGRGGKMNTVYDSVLRNTLIGFMIVDSPHYSEGRLVGEV